MGLGLAIRIYLYVSVSAVGDLRAEERVISLCFPFFIFYKKRVGVGGGGGLRLK